MRRDEAIVKIKKCLRLSKSSNPHEAAAALRQAQALMSEHGVELADVEAADVGEARARAGASRNPPSWEVNLVHMIKDCFACDVVFRGGWDRGEFVFVGFDANPTIAAYAFAVLLRQIRWARAQYIATRLRRCRPGPKVRRADQFCRGWVMAAEEKALAIKPTDAQAAAIAGYIESRMGETTATSGLNRGKGKLDDMVHGINEGNKAQLHRGVDATRPLALEAPK